MDPEIALRLCHNLGIVDYLSTTMQQDCGEDDTESLCSDYGCGLTISPPGKLLDTDCSIEATAVSSDMPLKTCPLQRAAPLQKPKLKALKWRSCLELVRPESKSTLRRQLSDQLLKTEGLIGSKMSVEVYDGNLGLSRVTLSRYRHGQSVCGLKDTNGLTDKLSCAQTGHKHEAPEGQTVDFSCDDLLKDDDFRSLYDNKGNSVPQSNELSRSSESSWIKKEVFGKMSGILKTPKNPKTIKTNKDELKFLAKMNRIPDFEMDEMLGIEDDDSSGPGLSEDEPLIDEVSCARMEVFSSSSKMEASRLRTFRQHPLPAPGGRTSILIAPADHRQLKQVVSTSNPSSQGESSAEESDVGVELSELERCVLSLTHRRNQLRKQDTNAFLIAPPEYKISEDFAS